MKKMKFKNPVCMICGKKFKSICDKSYTNVDGGTTFMITMLYGSDYDGNVYQAAICDECLDKCKEEKKIRLVEEGVMF